MLVMLKVAGAISLLFPTFVDTKRFTRAKVSMIIARQTMKTSLFTDDFDIRDSMLGIQMHRFYFLTT